MRQKCCVIAYASRWRKIQKWLLGKHDMYMSLGDIETLWFKYSNDYACGNRVIDEEGLTQFFEQYVTNSTYCFEDVYNLEAFNE